MSGLGAGMSVEVGGMSVEVSLWMSVEVSLCVGPVIHSQVQYTMFIIADEGHAVW